MVNYTFSVLSFDEEAIVHLGKEAAAFLEIQDVRLVSLILTRLKTATYLYVDQTISYIVVVNYP